MKKEHGHRRGRDGLGDSVRTGLALQSWTQSGPRRYWSVEGPSPAAADGSPRQRQRLDALHAEEERRAASETNRDKSDTGIHDLAFVSNWMRRTDWVRIFTGADRECLSVLTESPFPYGDGLWLSGVNEDPIVWSCVEDERKLESIGRAVDSLLDRCEDTVRHTDQSIRCWLRSQILRRPYKAPFELPARATPKARYHTVLKRLLYFAFRLHRLDQATSTPFVSKRLSKKQQQAIGSVWRSLDGQQSTPPQGLAATEPLSDTVGLSACTPDSIGALNKATASAWQPSDVSRSQSPSPSPG